MTSLFLALSAVVFTGSGWAQPAGCPHYRITGSCTSASLRTATVRFATTTSGRLVGAGIARRVVVGELARLDGHIVPAPAGGSRAPGQWRLISGPRQPPTQRSSSSAGVLSHPDDLVAGFRPEALGRYTLRFTSGRGRAARSDSVRLLAVPSNPLVSVDTMVRNEAGDPGIRVGETTYIAPTAPGQPSAIVQVLVLNRQTLAFVSNTTYTDIDQLSAALRGLDDADLVIAVLQKPRGAGSEPLKGQSLVRALAPIGFPNFSKIVTKPLSGGSVSAIGVPKTSPGDANVRVDPKSGEMNGYLTPDQHLEYGFVSPTLIKFDFAKIHPADSPGDAGYSVRVADAYTENVIETRFFGTGNRNSSTDQQGAQANAMADFLNRVSPGDLVEIQTVTVRDAGQDRYRQPVGLIARAPMVKLADAIARVGGTRNGFNLSALDSGPPSGAPVYTLVGWAGAGEGNGAEAALGVSPTGDTPDLSGTLRRNREYEFRPVQTSAFGPVSQAIEELTLRQPGSEPWPLDNDPGAHRALSYLGTIAPRLGCDPRSAYWTQGLTEADTTAIADQIKVTPFPAPGTIDPCTGQPVAFTEPEFQQAQAELVKELGWVGNVRSYLTKLSSPFADGALKSWTDAQSIADQVYLDARQPGSETALRWVHFTQIILGLLGPLTDGVSADMAGVIDFGMWLAGASQDGTPGGDSPRFKADKLGAELVDQALQAAATYTSIGNIIVSDYAKLRTVGMYGGCNPGQGGACPPEFAFTDADRVAASAAFYRGVQRLAYENLIPLGYRVFDLNPYPEGPEVNPYDPKNPTYHPEDARHPPPLTAYKCGGFYHPWNTNPPWPGLASTALLQKRAPVPKLTPPNDDTNEWQVLVLAAPPAVSDQHGTPPSETLLHRMFDPVSGSNDPAAGGLGMSPTQLYATAKHYEWEDNGPGKDNCNWYDLDTQGSPPVVGLG